MYRSDYSCNVIDTPGPRGMAGLRLGSTMVARVGRWVETVRSLALLLTRRGSCVDLSFIHTFDIECVHHITPQLAALSSHLLSRVLTHTAHPVELINDNVWDLNAQPGASQIPMAMPACHHARCPGMRNDE